MDAKLRRYTQIRIELIFLTPFSYSLLEMTKLALYKTNRGTPDTIVQANKQRIRVRKAPRNGAENLARLRGQKHTKATDTNTLQAQSCGFLVKT